MNTEYSKEDIQKQQLNKSTSSASPLKAGGTGDYSASLKSADTEEVIDLWFYRPIGYRWALLAKKVHITPNMITIASIFIGSAAGVLFYFPELSINIIGMLLLVLANSFDSADGQLARMTNNKTKLGRILDGLAGDIWFAIIYVVLALRTVHQGFYGLDNAWIWIIASAAGASHIVHASMADYYRNIHLYFLSFGKGGEFDNSRQLTEELKGTSFFKNPIKKIMLWFYRNYTRQQETLTPKFQKFIGSVEQKYPGYALPDELCIDFRAQSKPLMKYTNILQFNTRVIALFICLFLDQPFLYFIFDLVVLNSILCYMIARHERMCKRMTGNIREE